MRRWKWIALLTAIGGATGFLVSYSAAHRYIATALVAVTSPRYQLQFDPRIQTLARDQQPYRAYPELALSDDLITSVMEKVRPVLAAEERDSRAFREKLSARTGADPSLVRLSVSDRDPTRARTIANAWAEAYVQYANELYQPRSSTVAFFQEQVVEGNRQLQKAEEALIDYQRGNPVVILTAQLTAAETALRNLLDLRQGISLLAQDAQSLKQQMSRREANSVVTLADELSALYLQMGALSAGAKIPIQLQVDKSGSFSARSAGEQAAALDRLINVLQIKETDIGRRIDALKPEILRLQKNQAEAQATLDRLTRDRDVARDTYATLTRKLNESTVAVHDENSAELRLASRAAIASTRAPLRSVVITFLAGIVGMMAGIVGISIFEMRHPEGMRNATVAE